MTGGNALIQMDHVTFSYGGEQECTTGVSDIDLTIPNGQFVVLCGESGCGKTTVTRLINGLVPHFYEGKLEGKVRVDGKDISAQPLYETARVVGSVFQNPRSQFFNVDTTSEIAFGCENLGEPEEKIKERMEQAVGALRLETLMDRNIFELSGGEKQKIACAGAAVMEPDVFVLDEPSSNLDAAAVLDLRRTLTQWKEQGKTIVISEHRLYYLRGLADRFLYLKGGKIRGDYTAAEFEALGEDARAAIGLRAFDLNYLRMPVFTNGKKETIELNGFHFSYKNSPAVLHITDGGIPAGRIVSIIGHNGAGKSTFSRCFCGLEKKCGKIVWEEKTYRPKDRLNLCYMVMQDVNHQLFTESVLEEVTISMEHEDRKEAERILESLDLLGLKERHPMSLSGGQKQRVASALASGRRILLFDEPTSGLDARHMREVAEVLRNLKASGKTVYVITHDLELILACCTDVIRFSGGDIFEQYAVDASGVEKLKQFFMQAE